MAFSTSSGNSNSRGARPRGRRSVSVGTLSEMNVVPLVDVVLVLLIIFMVTAQAMQSGLDIQVPQVKEVKDTVEDLPIVEITRTGTPYLNDKPININLLGQEIAKLGKKNVYVRADKRGTVNTMVQVLYALSQAHIGVSVVTQQDWETPKP
jgi:biopolymer transport protein TolR